MNTTLVNTAKINNVEAYTMDPLYQLVTIAQYKDLLKTLVTYDIIVVAGGKIRYSTCDKWDVVVFNHLETMQGVPEGAYHELTEDDAKREGIDIDFLNENCQHWDLHMLGDTDRETFRTWLVRIDRSDLS